MKPIKTTLTYTNGSIMDLLDKLPNYSSRVFFIKYQNYLSLYDLFFYLYDKPNEPIDKRVYYNEIVDLFQKVYNLEYITDVYEIAMFNRENTETLQQSMKNNYCNEKSCNSCEYQMYCF
jgi:hypothetical protein